MTVEECQQRVTSMEYAEWMALYLMDPWDESKFRPAQAESVALRAMSIFNAVAMFQGNK